MINYVIFSCPPSTRGEITGPSENTGFAPWLKHSFSCDWLKTEYVVFFLSQAKKKKMLILWIMRLFTSHNPLLSLSYTGPSNQQSYYVSKDVLACCTMHCRTHLCYRTYGPTQKSIKGESRERNQEMYICI